METNHSGGGGQQFKFQQVRGNGIPFPYPRIHRQLRWPGDDVSGLVPCSKPEGSLWFQSFTHFELGFQLDSIATLGRKVRERKGAWVRKTVLLNNVGTRKRRKANRLHSCWGRMFMGWKTWRTMNQKVEKWSNSLWKNEQVHGSDQLPLPRILQRASLGRALQVLSAPAWKHWNP